MNKLTEAVHNFRGATLWRCLMLCLVIFVLSFLIRHSSRAQMLTGTYVGDGSDDRAIMQLGFQPDVVIIKVDTNKDEAVIRTSTMIGDLSKVIISSKKGKDIESDLIQSLDFDGFTIGSDSRVNDDGETAYWMAFKSIDGEVAVGSYLGNGLNNRIIDISDTSMSSDFQPDYVIVLSEEQDDAVQHSSAMGTGVSLQFDNTDELSDEILDVTSNGFEVGDGKGANEDSKAFHYVAWKAVTGKMAVGTYVGDGQDERLINGLGFDPEYVIIKSGEKDTAVHHPASLGPSIDASLSFDADSSTDDLIQSLRPASGCSNCFEVGKDNAVNDNGKDIFWAAFARQAPPTAVTMNSFTAAEHQGGVMLRWHTGWEADNLGFHVYREVAGARLQITPSWVAGSAFVTGLGTPLPAGNGYAWWDPAGLTTDRYWLTDVDLSGQTTWHGPITPEATTVAAAVPPTPVLLHQLGHQVTPRAHAQLEGKMSRTSQPLDQAVELPIPTAPQPWETREIAPADAQRALAATPAITFAVREVGWYQISGSELVAAGLPAHVDPRRLQLYAQGNQHAIIVSGEADGRLDPDDTLAFYGEGVDTLWTATQRYWLVVGGQAGQRVQRLASPNAPPGPDGYSRTLVHQPRTLYVAAVQNDDETNFFGAVVSSEMVEQSFLLRRRSTAVPDHARLTVTLQGVTKTPHQVAVRLNGHLVVTMDFIGQEQATSDASIPDAWLQDGANIVTLSAGGDGTDISAVVAIKLRYWHTSQVNELPLRIAVPGQQQVVLTGFSHPDIRVMDITNPQAVSEVQGAITPQRDGFSLAVSAVHPGPRRLLVFAASQVEDLDAIQAKASPRLHDDVQGADLVILSPDEFLDSMAPLQALREAQGWRVARVDVQDIYDAFSFGAKSPWALRDFLQWATERWTIQPRFVLLVGDASFDPRDYLGFGRTDRVPTAWTRTALLETASDDLLVDFDHDGMPELAIGRLPVRTAAEARAMVDKLRAYAAASGTWTRDALFVADSATGFDFEAASARVAERLLPRMNIETVVIGQSTHDAARAKLLKYLDAGQLLVNYLGHGSSAAWGSGQMLTTDDAKSLTNGDRLPIVAAMTCLNGFFHGPDPESLAEALVRAPHGGVIAVWASSGLTDGHAQIAMNQRFMHELYHEQVGTLGELLLAAKAASTDRDVLRTWLLFGDPTLKLKR